MNYTLYKKENYKESQWMGGTTTEFAIHPKTSKYLDRNFVWRLSSATIDNEESTFSKLADYDRVLMVLDGEVVLSYEGQRVTRLKELEQDRFDGAWATKSFGKIKDFNLMVRKGCEGYLDIIMPESESKSYTSSEETEKSAATHALFCKDGYALVGIDGQTQMVSAGELFVIECGPGEIPKYSIMGEGTIIRAQIFYDDMTGEVGPEFIAEEKATFDDFKMCVFLSNTQFRGAKYIFKSLKNTWYDEALSSGIKSVEKLYVTSILGMFGFAAVLCMGVVNELSVPAMLALIAAWLFVDCLIISPLIYMPFMPKPIRKHIKEIDKLTPYEQKVREAELNRNEQAERVLNKYKLSGKKAIDYMKDDDN